MKKEDVTINSIFRNTRDKKTIKHYKKFQYSKLKEVTNYAKYDHDLSDENIAKAEK